MSAKNIASEHLSVRLTPAGAEDLARIADEMGVSASALIEIQARRALTGHLPAPGRDYIHWITNTMDSHRGPLVIANRRLTRRGKEAVDLLADRWQDTQSGVVEYLTWHTARDWLPQHSEAA